MSVIKAEKITYSCPGGRRTGISDVSFEAEKGELTVILGPENSGKTAVVQLLNALVLPAEGKLSVCGIETDDKKALRELRKKCTVVFDRQRERFFTATPGDELNFSCRYAGIPKKNVLECTEKAKAFAGISDIEDTDFSLLGEADIIKTAAAVCLVSEPEIIIFDGSTSGLKASEKAGFFNMLKRMTASDIAVILTTTDSDDAVHADRVIVMCEGKKLGEGTAREILSDTELLKKSGSKPPFAVRVYRDLLDADAPLSEIPLTMDELVKEICR